MSLCNCIGKRIEAYTNTKFEQLGILIHVRPFIFFITGLILSILAGTGLINANVDNDIIELYLPKNDDIHTQYIQTKQLFGVPLESTLKIILCPKTKIDADNIFTPTGLDEAWSAYNSIHHLTTAISTNNNLIQTYSYFNSTDLSIPLCEKNPSSLVCEDSLNNFFGITFNNDPNLWQTQQQIDSAMNNPKNNASKIYISSNDECLLLTYSITSWDENSDKAKEIFIKQWTNYWSIHQNDYTQFTVFYIAPSSFEDFETPTFLLSVCMIILMIYLMLIFGKFNFVYSRCWLAFGGILSIALSVIAGFGIALFMGYSLTFYVSLLPFMSIGFGVDLMIFTVDTFNNIPLGDSDRLRFGSLIKQIGYLISTNTFSSICAFLCVFIGIRMNGVQTFCVFAIFCFLCNFMTFWLIFLPLMVWDNQRIAKGMNGILCCFEANISSKQEKRLPLISNVLKQTVLKVLNLRYLRILIVILCFMEGIFVCFIIPTTNTKTKRQTSAIYDEKYENLLISELDVIIQNIDLSKMEIRNNLHGIFDEFDKLDWMISNGTNEWLTQFESSFVHLDDVDSSTFYSELQLWTNETSQSQTNEWKNEIIYDDASDPTYCKAVRFFVFVYQNGDIYSQLQIRDEFMNILNKYEVENAFVFDINWALSYFEVIAIEFTVNLMFFCVIGIFVSLLLFIDLRILLLLLINVILMNVNLFAWINVCGLVLDTTTFIQCLMAIGFIIDYTMLIGHTIKDSIWNKAFYKNVAENKEILSVITSICRSAMTMFIALLPLSLANSEEIIEFYVMFIGIIWIALFQSTMFCTAIGIEMYLLFNCKAKGMDKKDDITKLTTTVEMNLDEIRKNIPAMTPEIELGANIDVVGKSEDDTNGTTKVEKETEKIEDGNDEVELGGTHRRRASTFDLTDVTPIPTFEPQDVGFPDLYGVDDEEEEVAQEQKPEIEINTPSRYIIRVESIDDDNDHDML